MFDEEKVEDQIDGNAEAAPAEDVAPELPGDESEAVPSIDTQLAEEAEAAEEAADESSAE